MNKKIVSLILLLSCTAALAGDAVIWNGQYGKFLPQLGLRLSDNKEYRTISVDPSAGAGVAAPVGSVAVRDNAGVGEAWFKAGAADTVWTNILTGLTGWTLTGNTATDDTINFLGTTDLQDLSIRTNNLERMRISDAARFDLYPETGFFMDPNVAAIVDYNHLYMGANITGAVSNNFLGPYLQPNFTASVAGQYYGYSDVSGWDAGTSVPNYIAFSASPNFNAGSSVTSNIAAFQFTSNFPAASLVGANVNGVSINPVITSNFLGYNGYVDQPNINGAMTNGYNGYSSGPQFSATSSMPSNLKSFNSQPNIATGATFTSGVGFFSGLNMASGVTANDWTDFQASPTMDSALSNYTGQSINPQGAGVINSVFLSSLSPNLTGDNPNVVGYNFGGTIGDDVTNYVGAQINPTATGTVASVTGISVNNSSLTSTVPKVGLSINDGSLNVQSLYDTATYGGATGVGSLNGIGGTFTVDAGFPVTGGGAVIANNLATVTNFNDDMPVDILGGLIGYTYVGYVGQTNITAGVTVDHINAALAGSGVSAASTGGSLTSADMYAAAGFLNQGGTIDITGEMRGLHLTSNLCNFVSGECFGIKDDVGARNYFLGGVELATSGAQPACSATIRGTLWVIQGGAGVADIYEICQKDAADVYAWTAVGSGSLSDYLYKPGLSGGQIATGGVDAGDDLVFRSTTNVTKGQVVFDETTASTSPATGAVRVDGGLGVAGQVSAGGALRSDTSLVLSDPGAGTNTVTVQAGVVTGSYSVTLPLAQATAANQALVNDGTGVTTWQSLGPELFGTRTAGRAIVAGTGITSGASDMSTTALRQIVFVDGSGGVDITATPQIEAGTIVGQEMRVCGTDDTDWVQLDTGTGLSINGPAILGKDDCINLMWLGSDGVTSDWVEQSRNL